MRARSFYSEAVRRASLVLLLCVRLLSADATGATGANDAAGTGAGTGGSGGAGGAGTGGACARVRVRVRVCVCGLHGVGSEDR